MLPPVYLAAGALPLPNSITFPFETVRLVIRQLLTQHPDGGFEMIVVFSGHGALDHLHVLRQECDRLMSRRPEIRARTTMWNELTVDVDGDIHDHGAKVETSYMMELWGDTVDLEQLTDDPGAEHVGKDIDIISCDDVPLAELFSPPITVINRDAAQFGRLAAEQLLRRLLAPDAPAETEVVPMTILLRQSTHRVG